jgi:hypothetical protein
MPFNTLNKDMNILLSSLLLKPARRLGIGLLSEPYMVHPQVSGRRVRSAKFLKRTLTSKVFGILLGIIAIALTIITIVPTFSSTSSGDESLELTKWTAAKDFKEACRDEKVSHCLGLCAKNYPNLIGCN